MQRSVLQPRTLGVLAVSFVLLAATFALLAPAASAEQARTGAGASVGAELASQPLRVALVAGSRAKPIRALRRGTCVIEVRSRATVRRVVVRLDGRVLARHRGKERRIARYRCSRGSPRLAPGLHVLRATVRDGAGRVARTRVAFVVPARGVGRPAPAPVPSAPAPAPAPATAPADPAPVRASASVRWTWYADLSTGDFSQWSWWGQGQSDLWGHISVVSPASQGIPAPTVGSPEHVGRMEVTPADVAAGRTHAKLYKGFRESGRSPADVSGRYSAWYYVPSSYRVPRGTDANVFQFKEKHGERSDPLWWIQFSTGSWARGMGGASWIGARPTGDTQPVAMLHRTGNDWRRRLVFMTVPLDRWFEIRAELYQGDRIEFSIDGQPFDVARASEYPVSPFRSNSQEWTFGAGNYTAAPGTVLYLGGAGYAQR